MFHNPQSTTFLYHGQMHVRLVHHPTDSLRKGERLHREAKAGMGLPQHDTLIGMHACNYRSSE